MEASFDQSHTDKRKFRYLLYVERDKLDHCWSTKLIIPPSSNAVPL